MSNFSGNDLSGKVLSKDELIEKLSDPDIPFEDLQPYFTFKYSDQTPFDIRPDLDLVNVAPDSSDDEEIRTEAAVVAQWALQAVRTRRKRKFFAELEKNPDASIVIQDGDSWMQHPLVAEIYNHLNDGHGHNVYCSSIAGRTLKAVHADNHYITMLDDIIFDEGKADNLKAVVFSGGGNDLFGDKLKDCLLKFEVGRRDTPEQLIKQEEFKVFLAQMHEYYAEIIANIDHRFPDAEFKIILHSYAYLKPWDVAFDILLPKDKWLGDLMRDEFSINDVEVQKKIIQILLNQFHGMLLSLARDSGKHVVKVVDNRNKIPHSNEYWSDEIHPSDSGFAIVCKGINEAING